MNIMNDDLEQVKLKIIELGPNEILRPAETYYITEHHLLCCNFLDREDSLPGRRKGEDLGMSSNFAIATFGDGQPSFIEFLRGIGRWKTNEQFSVPIDCKNGRVYFSLPLSGWYPNPFIECDDKKKNVCICLSNNNIVKKIRIAEDVIFGLDKDHQLNRIWLLNIEYRKDRK